MDTMLSRLLAVCLGLGLPLFMIGRTPMGIALGVAALILVAGAVRDRCWSDWRDRLLSPAGIVLVLTFSWWFVGSLLSFDPVNSFKVWGRSLLFLLLGMEIARQFTGRPDMTRIFMAALLTGSAVIITYILAVVYVDWDYIGLLEALRGKELNLRRIFKPYSSILACMVPLLVWWGYARRGGMRWFSWLLIPACMAAIYHAGWETSRSAVLGLIAGVAGMAGGWLLARFPVPARRMVVAAALLAMVAGGILFLQALPHKPFDGMRLPEIALPFPDMHRQVIWGFVSDLAAANPLLGVGIDSSNLLPEAREQITLNLQFKTATVEYVSSHPHNWILEIAAETGLPGLAGTVAAILFLGGEILRNRELGTARWAAVGILTAFWISSLANFSIWTSWWQAALVLLLGITLAQRRAV